MFRRSSPAGLILALTALVFQLAFGVPGESMRITSDAVPVQLQALSALLPGADILCHTDNEENTGQPTSPAGRHHHGDCAICPICFALGHSVAMLAVPPSIPEGSAVAVRLAAPPPPATAPPSLVRTNTQPRAPPILT